MCGACRVRIQIHKHHQCVDAFLSIALACTGTKWPHKFFCELFSTHRVPQQCPVDSESHIEPHRCCTPSWGQGSSQKTRPEAWRIRIASDCHCRSGGSCHQMQMKLPPHVSPTGRCAMLPSAAAAKSPAAETRPGRFAGAKKLGLWEALWCFTACRDLSY